MTTELRSSACFVALQSFGNADGGADWLHLLPAGTFAGADGRGPYVAKDAAEIIRLSMADGKIAIDECHSIDLAGPKGLPAPARGWVTEMQARPDGIWGRVEWTPTGQTLRSEHAYRGLSPVLRVRVGGAPIEVASILRASLTNDPNLSLTHLHHQEHDMLSAETLRRLGLAADADAKAVETAIGKIADQVETHGKIIAAVAKAAGAKDGASGDELVTHLQSQSTTLAAIAKAAGKEGASGTELVTHLQARAAAGDPTQLAQTVVELQGRIDKLTNDTAKKDAEAFIDGQIAAGKPIKALRDHYITRHQKDAAGVETELKAMASVHDGRVVPPAGGKAAVADTTNVGDIVAKAQLHQKEHPDKLWADCVLAVSEG